MATFNAYEYHTDSKREDLVCSCINLENCVRQAANHVRENCGLYGDTVEIVEESLRTRMYYVCSYGGSSIEIREE